MSFMESICSSSLESFGGKLVFNHKLIIYRDRVRLGEWSQDEVWTLKEQGLLYLTDYYWRQGMKEWAPLQALLKPLPKKSIFSKQN